jgi:hypothetical protein
LSAARKDGVRSDETPIPAPSPRSGWIAMRSSLQIAMTAAPAVG